MRTLVLAIALFLVAPAAASAAPTVTLDKPGPGAVAGTIAVAATATGAARVEFSVDGEVKLIDHSAPYGGSFDTETVADGSAQITATAFGGGGLSASSSVTVTIDNTRPSLTVTGPDKARFAPGSTQSWTIGASDAGSGIAQVRCSVQPINTAPKFGPCTSADSFVLTNQPEGTWAFSVRAIDGVGHFVQTGRVFKIEATPPLVAGPGETAVAPAPPAAPAVTTGAQKAAPAPQILVSLGFSFTSNRRATKLANFVVKHVPAGATVTVKCPKGCARKAFKKARVRGRLLLKPLVSRPLKRGTKVIVIVSKPGFSSAVKVLTIRARKAPLVTTLCLPEGSSKPAAC